MKRLLFFVLSLVIATSLTGSGTFSSSSLSEDCISQCKSSRFSDFYEAYNYSEKTSENLPQCKVVNNAIWLKATDYTRDNNLENSIKHFIESILNTPIGTLTCVDPLRIGLKESVFIAKEQGVVVKVFPQTDERRYKMIREISGREELATLDLQEGRLVNFLGIGKCSVNETNNLLLLISLAPGEKVSHFIEAIFSSSDRSAAIEKCQKILFKLGEALGEVHAKKAKHLRDSPDISALIFKQKRAKIEKYLETLRSKIDVDFSKLESNFADKMEKYDVDNTYLTIIHGDPHLENFHYDEEEDRVVIFDTPGVHQSVDSHEEPISASYIHDIASVEEDIMKRVLLHERNDDLMKTLADAFLEGYMKWGKEIFIPSQVDLSFAHKVLSRWISVSDWEKETNPETRESKRRIFQWCHDTLDERHL